MEVFTSNPWLLHAYGVNNERQNEMYTTKVFLPELNSFEIEIAIQNLKEYKLSGTDQIPLYLLQGSGKVLLT